MTGLLDYISLPEIGAGGSSILDRIGAFAGNNSNALIGLGAGIAGGGKNWNEAVGRGLQGFQSGMQQDRTLENQRQTLAGLVRQGIHPQIAQMAMSNPEILKAIILNIVPKYDFRPINNVGGRFDPATGRWDPVAEGPKTQAAPQGQGLSVAGRALAPGQASPMPPSNAPQFPNYGKLPQLWTAPAAPLGGQVYEQNGQYYQQQPDGSFKEIR